jgi:chemotaxis protein methyltransferase CheR
MTTNETNWFRDIYPYKILTEVVFPQYKAKDKLRIWSTACSTGQEPYSISICVSEYAEKITWGPFANIVKIFATDISSSVLGIAKKGEYGALEMERGLSPERKIKFFEQLKTGKYRLNNNESSRVVFQQFNLLSNFIFPSKFDVIFCRNVLIYFSSELKATIIDKFANILENGGYLFLGSSESMPTECNKFKIINCQPGIIYQKK